MRGPCYTADPKEAHNADEVAHLLNSSARFFGAKLFSAVGIVSQVFPGHCTQSP